MEKSTSSNSIKEISLIWALLSLAAMIVSMVVAVVFLEQGPHIH